ncbi:hypothetical protein [Microbacterium sp. Marseille-Q6965]|uniref:hypothetical protein n=1 Tax=Microbacterium sp. Marseille-Q6965 TaxID=2965072 RepID=UPI0021B7191D|nr:hypothetical protein [Microbacterium sp. Marseille-Q6965]
MALDTMLAADIEQQLKAMDETERAQFTLDLVELVHRYASSGAMGEARLDDSEARGLGEVVEAARRHLDVMRQSPTD